MSNTAALARLSRLTLAVLTTWALCGHVGMATAADPVWRCTTTTGNAVAYQSTPCRDAGRALPSGKHPTPEDQEASARVAEREAKLARAMGRQRIKREKDLPSAHTSLSGPVRQVSVGQREDDLVKARKRNKNPGTDQGADRAHQRRHDVFRAQAPGRSPKQSGAAQADAVSASPP